MKAFTKKDLYKLKAAINGFTDESRRILKKEINSKHLEGKTYGWNRKRSLGWHSRLHQLAYALMLGKRYDDVESNRSLYFNDWQLNEAVRNIASICIIYGGYRVYLSENEFNENNILHWLKTGDNVIFRWEKNPKKFKVSCRVTKILNKSGEVA